VALATKSIVHDIKTVLNWDYTYEQILSSVVGGKQSLKDYEGDDVMIDKTLDYEELCSQALKKLSYVASPIMQSVMIKNLGLVECEYLCIIRPPWTGTDILKIFNKHWVAVFSPDFPNTLYRLIKELLADGRNPRFDTQKKYELLLELTQALQRFAFK
jgi:hypothetical protein